MQLDVPVVYTETTLLLEPPRAPTPTPTPTSTATHTPVPTCTPTIIPAAVGSIAGLVWSDDDSDGELDPGEGGIGQVRIEIWLAGSGAPPPHASMHGDEPLRFTYTGFEGRYRFENVPVGDYIVKEIGPEGYGSSTASEVLVTVIEGETVEASFGDYPIWHEVRLPLILK